MPIYTSNFQIFSRILTISSAKWKSGVKNLATWLLLLFFSTMIWVSPDFALFAFSDKLRMIFETCYNTVFIGSLFITIFITANTIQEEFDDRTLLTIISKPVQRWEFILGQFVGSALLCLTSIVILSLQVYLLTKFRVIESHYTKEILTLTSQHLYCIGFIFTQCLVLFSFSMALMPYFKTPLNLCFTAIFFILANSISYIQNAVDLPSLVVFTLNFLFYFIPDMNLYNLAELFALGQQLEHLPEFLGKLALYSFGAILFWLGITVLTFNTKDIS